MEPKELSPALLQPQVSVVATLPWLHDDVRQLVSPKRLNGDLEDVTRELRATLQCTEDTWKRHNVTSNDDGSVTSLSQVLATYRSSLGTPQGRGATTEGHKCHHQAPAPFPGVRCRAAGAGGRGGHTTRGHWAEVALQRLVAACDKATLFNGNMEWQLRDVKAMLEVTIEASPDVLQASVAQVAEFERVWGANACLAEEHVLGTLGDIENILSSPCDGPSSRVMAERCQKTIEDIPRLLQGQ